MSGPPIRPRPARRRAAAGLALLAGLAPAVAARIVPRPVWDGPGLLERADFSQDFERLVIKFREGTGVRVRAGALAIDSASGPAPGTSAFAALAEDLRLAEALVAESGHGLTPLFSQAERELDRWRQRVEAAARRSAVDLNLYAAVELPDLGRATPLEDLAWSLVSLPCVEIVYPETLTAYPYAEWRGPTDFAPPGITPNYMGLQGYLGPAPAGVDAFYAWTVPGGAGQSVRVYDVDTGVNAAHEDLPALFASDGAGYDSAHGTAVLGVIAAENNGLGLKGIAYQAEVGLKDASGVNSAANIQSAVMALAAGDVVLLETAKHLGGWACPCNPTQAGFVAQEVYQAQFDVIQQASWVGITVVETGGNGCVDYDDAGFGGWFDRNVQDSGGVIVGAGQSGIREPVCYSPYGDRIDLHAWAEDIVCLEFVRPSEVPVFDGGPNRLYGPNFGGTSGAGAIVAGVVASLQGAMKASNQAALPLTVADLRDLLVATGTPQSGDFGRPIGPMPDLAAAIQSLP